MIGKRIFVVIWLFIMLIAFGYEIGNRYENGSLGALLGLLVFVGLCIIYIGIAFLWTRWQPAFPHCRQCRKCEGYKTEETIKDGFCYRCSCGIKYTYKKLKSGEVEFQELLPDNTTRPYMKRSRFGRWKSDST